MPFQGFWQFRLQTHGSNVACRMSGAAEPLIPKEFAQYVERKSRPAHVGIPRKRMELPFAVQLMRNSYATADDLDFVPMDEFQRDFFLFRQSEWEDYRNYHPNVMQGDLADPVYFDFISFAQYATIAYKAKYGKMDFVEKFNADGDSQVVKRNKYLEDNSILPLAFTRLVGDKLLDFMLDKYPTITPQDLVRPNGTTSTTTAAAGVDISSRTSTTPSVTVTLQDNYIPIPLSSTSSSSLSFSARTGSKSNMMNDFTVNLTDQPKLLPKSAASNSPISPEKFAEYAQLLLDIFTINSYAVSAYIRALPVVAPPATATAAAATPERLFQVVLKAPVNLWSLQVLKQRKDSPRNDFELMVLDAVARRCNLRLEVVSTEVLNSIDIMHIIKIIHV